MRHDCTTSSGESTMSIICQSTELCLVTSREISVIKLLHWGPVMIVATDSTRTCVQIAVTLPQYNSNASMTRPKQLGIVQSLQH